MFYWLIDLSNTVPGLSILRPLLNVFRYITFRTGGAMVTGALFVFLFGPWIIDNLRLRQGKGQPIRTDGPQSHLTKKGTPTMGGLMILSGLVVSTVLWADVVVVVDSFSTDRTAELATALGARVVQVEFKGFGDLRNKALEACTHEWIFSLDSDERCTAEVRDESLALIGGNPAHDVYLVPRRSYMMGR